MRVRAAYVFAQTDGEPLPEFGEVTGDPHHYTAQTRATQRAPDRPHPDANWLLDSLISYY